MTSYYILRDMISQLLALLLNTHFHYLVLK